MIERRRIWTDAVLADYIRDELGFPGARQGAMVEKETVDIATGEVSRERWYLLTNLSSRQWGPRELLRLFRNHWSAPNSLHHVKDRSWDEDVHTLRRPGLGEVFAALVNTGLNALRLEGMVSTPDVHAPSSQELRLPLNTDHRPPLRTNSLTLQSSWAWSASLLTTRRGWFDGTRVSRSMKASRVTCGSCLPRIGSTSIRVASRIALYFNPFSLRCRATSGFSVAC